MKQYTITLKDNKQEKFLLELLGKFDFVEVQKNRVHKTKVIEGLREAVKEVKLAKEGKIKLKSFDEFLNEL